MRLALITSWGDPGGWSSVTYKFVDAPLELSNFLNKDAKERCGSPSYLVLKALKERVKPKLLFPITLLEKDDLDKGDLYERAKEKLRERINENKSSKGCLLEYAMSSEEIPLPSSYASKSIRFSFPQGNTYASALNALKDVNANYTFYDLTHGLNYFTFTNYSALHDIIKSKSVLDRLRKGRGRKYLIAFYSDPFNPREPTEELVVRLIVRTIDNITLKDMLREFGVAKWPRKPTKELEEIVEIMQKGREVVELMLSILEKEALGALPLLSHLILTEYNWNNLVERIGELAEEHELEGNSVRAKVEIGEDLARSALVLESLLEVARIIKEKTEYEVNGNWIALEHDNLRSLDPKALSGSDVMWNRELEKLAEAFKNSSEAVKRTKEVVERYLSEVSVEDIVRAYDKIKEGKGGKVEEFATQVLEVAKEALRKGLVPRAFIEYVKDKESLINTLAHWTDTVKKYEEGDIIARRNFLAHGGLEMYITYVSENKEVAFYIPHLRKLLKLS